VDRRACFIDWYAEDVEVVRQEEGNQRSGNVQGRSEDNANVPDGHLVHSCVFNNLNQKQGEVPEKLKVDSGQLVHEYIEGLDFLGTLIHIW
jgi:hypothetical protein